MQAPYSFTLISQVSFGLRNTKECSMTYRQSRAYNHKLPQKFTTTACFIQGEYSGGGQISNNMSCFMLMEETWALGGGGGGGGRGKEEIF